MSGDESSMESSGSHLSERVGTVQNSDFKDKPIAEWSIQAVAGFLQAQGFGSDVVSSFVNEMIGGPELLELDSSDLRELGVSKMGPRKKLLSKVAKLKSKGVSAIDESDTTATHSASESESGQGQQVSITALFKKQKQELTVSSTTSLEKLLLMLSNAFGVRVKIKLIDDEGDQVPIKSDADLYDVMVGEEKVTLQCIKDFKWKGSSSGKGSLAAPAMTRASAAGDAAKFADKYDMFDSLLDAYIVIDEDGTVLAFNPASEKVFGYAKRKVVGRNIKMLMPDTYANKHDQYLSRYVRTGIKHVVDSKRTVMAKHSGGDMLAVELAVTEKQNADGGSSHFVGVIKPQDKGDGSSSTSASDGGSVVRLGHRMRANLMSLQEAAIAIDNVGTVLLFNGAAEKLFGHKSATMVGNAVEALMPSPHKENHAFYLQRYVATGEKRVMNSSRNVTALHADGSQLQVNLSLSEKQNKEGETIFIGLLSSVKASVKSGKSSSVLQMTRRLINSMTVPGIVINDQGIIQAFNRSAEKMLGFALIDVVGRNVNMLMNDDDAPKHDDYLQHYLTTGEERVIGKERIVQAKHKSGKLIKVQLSVTVAEDEDGKKIFTGMLHKHGKGDKKKKKGKRSKDKGATASSSQK